MNRPWTKEDDEYLSEHYPYEEAHKIACILFRTLEAVRKRARFLGVCNRPVHAARPANHCARWSEEDDLLLLETYSKRGARYLSRKLGRSVDAVQRRATDLGATKKARGRRPWTMADVRFLQEHYQKRGAKWCAPFLRRTDKAVRSAAAVYGLRFDSPRFWSDKEILTLRRMWRAREAVGTIAARLGRSAAAVQQRAYTLGLKRRDSVKKTRKA